MNPNDRTTLIRLASQLPSRSDERKAVLKLIGGPLMLRRDYGSVKQAASGLNPSEVASMMRRMRKGQRVKFDRRGHQFGGPVYEKVEDGPDGGWLMASAWTGKLLGAGVHSEWVQDAVEVAHKEAQHSFGVSETWGYAASHGKTASTGQNCEFYKARDGKWYMGLSAERPEYEDEEGRDWDDAIHDWHGPFESFEEAHEFLRRNFANPGGYHSDDSGRRPPPKRPHSPARGW